MVGCASRDLVCSSGERAIGFGNGLWISCDFLSLRGSKSGGWCRDCTHAARRLTRFSGPGHYCSANHPSRMQIAECGMHNSALCTPHSALRTPHSAFESAARVGLAPTPCGLTNRRATLTPPGNFKLALPAGVAPASIRLEDECLVYFGHGSGSGNLD